MEAIYTERQNGNWILIILALAGLGPAILILLMEDVASDKDSIFAATSAIVLMFLVGILFFRLKTEVYRDKIKLSFGVGTIRKNIPLSSIKEVAVVRNKWYFGWGIRYYGKGWLWNIWGLDAVEITYSNKKSRFRIGSQDANKLKDKIDSFIKLN